VPDATIISRRGDADTVVMPLARYLSLMETMHLLATPANAAHLAKSHCTAQGLQGGRASADEALK
jgi:antitoxin YefM